MAAPATARATPQEQLAKLEQLISDDAAVEKAAHEMFSKRDADKSGAIDHAEARALLKAVWGLTLHRGEPTDEDVDAFFAELDANKDGELSVEEFVPAVKRAHEKRAADLKAKIAASS